MKKFRRNFKIAILLIALSMILFSPLKSQLDYLDKLPPLIDRELFFGDTEISYSQLSPDGKYFTFLKQYNGVRNIYIKKIDEPFEKAIPLTADERPVPGYFWSEDSRYILYVQDKGGNENFHVYAVNPADKADNKTGVPPAHNLTPYGEVRALIYSVPEKTPETIIVGLNERDPSYHDVYKINIITGERELLIENTEKMSGYFYDQEGNVRLASRRLDDGGSELLRVDGDKYTQVYTTTFEEFASPIRFHKNGKEVYMETNKGNDVDLSRLVLFNPVTLEETPVESDPENQVDFGSAMFSDKTDELIATYYTGDKTRIYIKDKELQKDYDYLRKKLPHGEISFQSSTKEMDMFKVVIYSDVDPGSVYLYNRNKKTIDLQYKVRPELDSDYMAPMQAIRYKARDGMEIPAYLTTPKGVDAKNLATVVMPHGGPWARDNWGYDPYAQFLANRGYAVLQPNFRGSTGYGKKFLNAGNKQWGTGDMQHDISDGVKYLIDQGISDPDKIAIFGGSYGGYATLAGLAFTPDLYAAGISYVGPSNLITLLNSIPPYWASVKKLFDKRLGNPDDPEDKKELIKNSPLFSADQIKAPLMVIQGDNDPRVKTAESDQIVMALRDMGYDVAYLLAKDEGHGFRGEENRLASTVAMEKFLAKHLNGRYQKEMPDNIKAKLEELSVDINTVSLPDTTLVRYAETAPLPKLDPSKVAPGTFTYMLTVSVAGQQMEMEVTRTIFTDTHKGKDVWVVAESSQTPMGKSNDTMIVDAATLTPVKRSAVQGPAKVELVYSNSKISGAIDAGGQIIPVDHDLTAPVLGDGPANDLSLSTLPLVIGYKTTLRSFELIQQKVNLLSIHVVGEESVEAGGKTYETFRVELQNLGGESGGGTYFVSKAKPYMVVKSEVNLPKAMGGGTATGELIKYEK